ncbi:MAG: DNA polymerase III subunit delta' [Pseudomonadota bacterium]
MTPQSNPGLLGQEAAEARLLAALDSGRLPHAWLFTGPRGIGKATLAYRFARSLLAYPDGRRGLDGSLTLEVDAEDPAFRQVAAASHPDLVVLQRSVNEKTGKLRSEILVEAVRSAAQSLRRTASAGGWRLLIVDSADDLNRSAANALLKVLEEPPPRTLLLLIAHAPASLLATLRSRCCRLPLAPLSEPLLLRLLAEQMPDLEEADRQLLAGLGDGSIGQALGLQEAGGLDLYRRILGLLGRAGRPMDRAEAHALAEEIGRDTTGERFRQACGLLTWWLGRAVAAGARGQPQAVLSEEERGLMEGLLARRALADWAGLWEKLSLLTRQADSANLDRKQAFLSVLIDLEAPA